MAVKRSQSKRFKAVKKTITRGGRRVKTTVYKLKKGAKRK